MKNDEQVALTLICTKKEADDILKLLRSESNTWEKVDDNAYVTDYANGKKSAKKRKQK